jgi:tRNA threonylcarbamoyladenosine biosynthesis protein TsaB
MSYILCVETGTDTCSVGLAKNGALAALRESAGERDHARLIAVYTEEVLAEAGITASTLDAVAVSKGPGSYTGLRIGVSFAKGLCYGLNLPLIGIGSLDSLCQTAINNYELIIINYFIPMIDARRMEVFGQVFDAQGTALTVPEAWIIDENSLAEWREKGEVLIFGSGAAKCRETLPWARYIDVEPSANGMVRLAAEAFEAGNFEDTAYFEPFYLKDFVITTSKKKLF